MHRWNDITKLFTSKPSHWNWVTNKPNTANGFRACSTQNCYFSHFRFSLKIEREKQVYGGKNGVVVFFSSSSLQTTKLNLWAFLGFHSIYQVINIEHKSSDRTPFNWHSIKINKSCCCCQKCACGFFGISFYSVLSLSRSLHPSPLRNFYNVNYNTYTPARQERVKSQMMICAVYNLSLSRLSAQNARNSYHLDKYTDPQSLSLSRTLFTRVSDIIAEKL